MEEYPIDAVITWVDGNDPVHRRKRQQYSDVPDQLENEDIGGDIRFTSVGEIKYCVASLLRFAPFLRKIFIVTDGQNPHLDDFIQENFPGHKTQLEIVDHKVIYRDHEELLPVFNSLSIETVLWRIPDLSEHYVYFNDDVMLVSPTTPATFFDEGRNIVYGNDFSLAFAKLLRRIKPKKHGHKVFGFKDAMVNACDQIGHKGSFPLVGHIAHIQRKSIMQDYFYRNPGAMVENMRHRFRVDTQYNPQMLNYLLGLESGKCVQRSGKGMDLYLKPKDKKGYVQAHLDRFDRSEMGVFCCMNSLDLAKPEEQELVFKWLRNRLQIHE